MEAQPEVQSLTCDARVDIIDGPMCRWSMKAPRSNGKWEFMRKQTRRLTSSKDDADVPRGDGRGKHDRRYVFMTVKPEATSEYPTSLVVVMLSTIKRQMISDGVIEVGEVHFAGPVPDEVDYPAEHGGTWRIDHMRIDPRLLADGRKRKWST